jgi:hypothetical protein
MQPGLQRKYSPSGFVPIGMDCMALTCLRQVSANGIPQTRRRRGEELERKAWFFAPGIAEQSLGQKMRTEFS